MGERAEETVAAYGEMVYRLAFARTGTKFDADGNFTSIVPGAYTDAFGIDGVGLTGIGYVDGRLHVQVGILNRHLNDNHGSLTLKKDNGSVLTSDYLFYPSRDESGPERIDHIEYVFNVPQEELAEYTLWADFVTSGMRVEGDWKVTFPLEQAE